MISSSTADNSFVLFADGIIGAKVSAILAREKAAVKAIVLKEDAGSADRNGITSPWMSSPVPMFLWRPGEPDGAISSKLTKVPYDIGLLAWWPHIISDRILSTARKTFLNLHPSLLPYGRGKDPNFWALAENSPFGVTIHHVVRAVDRGPIAFQRAIPVTPIDTGETLYAKALAEMESLFQECCRQIMTGTIPRIEQPKSGTFHLRRELDPASEICLDETYRARDLINLLRARTFPPHSGCWFEQDGKQYEIQIQIREKTV